MPFLIRLAFASLAILSTPAAAHDGHEHAGWTLSPSVLLPLALAALLYAIGLARLWRRAARGRAQLRRGAILYALGWLSLTGALVSPLHEAGERSFTPHMIEHEIIMLVSALLFVAARPGVPLLWAMPDGVRQRLAGAGRWTLWRVLADPFVATALQSALIVAWHAPSLFDRALRNEGWHIAQHISFLVAALLFWRAMLYARPGRGGAFVAAACLFVTSMIGGGLGALMSFAHSPWYEAYASLGMTPSGLTPEQDQQLAGLVMWVPGGLYHLAAALWFLGRAVGESGENAVAPG